MNRFHIMIVIITLLCYSCREDYQYVEFQVSSSGIECDKDGGRYEIGITGSDNWVTDNTARWIDIDRTGNKAIVEIAPNSEAAREATFNFIHGHQKVPFTVSQERSDIFTINLDSIASSYKGGTWTIEVNCYDSWSIYEDCDWISTAITGSDRPEEVEIIIMQNSGKEARASVIDFICDSRKHSVRIEQEAGPYIAFETEEIIIDGDGGIAETLFISNTEVEISTEEGWIRIIESGNEIKKVVFEVLRNLSGPRTGYVKVTAIREPDYYKFIKIIQGEKIDHPKIRFEEGTYLQIKQRDSFTLHPIFEDMTDTALVWSSDSPERASVDQEGRVSIHSGGNCIITARNALHNVFASITLDIKLKAEYMEVFLGTQKMTDNPTAVRFPGEVLEVTTIMHPEDSYSDDIVCISSDPSVVSVSGMSIKCLKPGKAVISVESIYQNLRNSFTVIVLEP